MAPGARSTMSPAPAPVLLLLLCAARTGSTAAASGPSSRWASQPASQRGAPPYPFPATHADGTAPRYQTRNEKDGQDEHKINVHLVPHTHDDTGWQITVDQYFFNEVYYVVDTVIDQLEKDPKRHFIYVETAFFARWWDEQPDARRAVTKRLVENGQLEFINGGWCMHDEGSPLYTEMVDQTTRGHQFLRKNFGDAAIPRGTWQIDPFGHSNTQAWLLGSEAGFESLYWGRTDYQDLNNRLSYEGQQQNQWPEWVWQGSHSLGKSAELFAGQLTTGGYGAPGILHDWGSVRGNSIDESTSFVQDNPSRHDYNLDAIMDDVISQALKLANTTRGNHQLWPVGSGTISHLTSLLSSLPSYPSSPLYSRVVCCCLPLAFSSVRLTGWLLCLTRLSVPECGRVVS
jgi:alpha-mannosidase